MKVLCIVTNGFEEVEFVGTVGISSKVETVI